MRFDEATAKELALQVDLPQTSRTSKIISGIWLAVIVLVVWGMQIGLTYVIFANSSHYHKDRHQPFERLGWANWNHCLRLTGLLYSTELMEENNIRVVSVTVCKEELIVLFEKTENLGARRFTQPVELVRINLKTGRVTSSAPPRGVRNVFSDGNTLWLLPGFSEEVQRASRSGRVNQRNSVFLWDGVPSMISPALETGIPTLIQYVHDQWEETDRCVLMMEPEGPGGLIDNWGIDQSNGQLHLWLFSQDCFWSHSGLQLGTEQDYDQFQRIYGIPMPEQEMAQLGWHRVNGSWLPTRTSGGYVPLGFWFDHGQPFGIALQEYYVMISDHIGRVDWDYHGLRWGPISESVKVDGRDSGQIDGDRTGEGALSKATSHDTLQIARFPAPWSIGSDKSHIESRFVRSNDGRNFVHCRHADDGRLHLFELVNGQSRLVAFQRGWLIRQVCVEAAALLAVIVLAPMMLLGFVASFRQRPQSIESGVSSIAAASIMRRGTARAIDLFLVGSLFVLSVLMHPDVMSWWVDFIGDLKSMSEFGWYFKGFGILGLDFVVNQFHTLAKDVLAVPVISWLLIASLIFETAQLVWQAKTGRTVGKWLLGIKVARTTLRPCGFARSLLREILLVVDSLFLFSWVPGVIAILSSRRAQRIGDYWADTVVVRDKTARESRE